MKFTKKYLLIAAALLPAAAVCAQSAGTENFVIKATGNYGAYTGLGAKYALPDIDSKASSYDFGVEFGWTFWKHGANSLGLNGGLGYESTAITASLDGLKYNYSAPAAADMDNEPYIRYYELQNLHQKFRMGNLAIPVFVNYRYQINEIFSVEALAGFKIGFNVSNKLSHSSGGAYSYGIYPQYADLLIDASYMNMFGETTPSAGETLKPQESPASAAFLAGIAAEVKVHGPFSVAVNARFEKAFNNAFRDTEAPVVTFDASNAPVTYTAAGGQQVKALPTYFTTSKISRFSVGLSLIYRFDSLTQR